MSELKNVMLSHRNMPFIGSRWESAGKSSATLARRKKNLKVVHQDVLR